MTAGAHGGPAVSPAAALRAFAAGRRHGELPAAIVEQAKLSLLNVLATTVAGAQTTAIGIMARTLSRFSGPGQAIVLGRGERVDAPTAAYLNAAAANVHDFDDTHVPTIIHPSAPIAAPLLALADCTPTDGAAFLHAFAVGVEVACRLGNAISPQHYAKGWHITTTCGVVGAAAAASHGLGLTEQETNDALAIAACQAAGTVEALGTDAKSVAVGNAARNGLLAALLARSGLSGPAGAIDGRFGFLQLFRDGEISPAALSDGLGERWELASNTFKPYPCGVVVNAVIDACIEIRDTLQPQPDEIVSIHVRGDHLLIQRADRPHVTTGRMSQISAQHAAAVTLLWGKPGLEAFGDRAVADEAVRSLRMKVSMMPDRHMPAGAAEVSIVLQDGRTMKRTVLAARGSLQAPLTRGDVEEKFVSLSSGVLAASHRHTIIETVWELEKLRDMSLLTRLLAV